MGSYISNTAQQRQAMLKTIGLTRLDELYADVPDSVRIQSGLKLKEGLGELEVSRQIRSMANKNVIYESCFRGAGAYRHYIPAAVKSIVSKEEFVTAYTPYQAEISQGILQSIFEYQTMIAELTGMDAANASVYDGATAAAEAVALCQERKKRVALISSCVHPQVIETIRTYCFGNGMEIRLIEEKEGVTDLEQLQEALGPEVACVLLQQPNFYGNLEDVAQIEPAIHAQQAKLIISCNPIALALMKAPGELKADIAVGEGQPLGLSLSFGGPYLGFMAVKEKLMRKLPGRIVGQTRDSQGRIAYVLTLQAREQHIRREKASSNICSNEAHCALTAAVYLAMMGKSGLQECAHQCHSKAAYLRKELEKIGYLPVHARPYFHEFVTSCPQDVQSVLQRLAQQGILGGLPISDNRILWCVTELISKEEMDRLITILKEGKA